MKEILICQELKSILFFILNGNFFFIVQLQLSQFFPCGSPPPCLPTTPTVNPHPIGHVHGSFIHVPWLDHSPSFPHYPHSPSHCQFFPYFHISSSILFICFVLKEHFIQCGGLALRSPGICPSVNSNCLLWSEPRKGTSKHSLFPKTN